MNSARAVRVGPGSRLQLEHGPISILADCSGEPAACEQACHVLTETFSGILEELVMELPALRSVLTAEGKKFTPDSIAHRMVNACWPLISQRISPMAAVAGSVADHLLDAIRPIAGLSKVWINNGGDIAFFVDDSVVFHCGLVPDIGQAIMNGVFSIEKIHGIGGIASSGQATKGQGGRSFSLGIADSVTVLARNAASADAAATIIANHVDTPACRYIERVHAEELDPDTDLRGRLVVTKVGYLSDSEIEQSIATGADYAHELLQRRVIKGAVISLRGKTCILEEPGRIAGSRSVNPSRMFTSSDMAQNYLSITGHAQ